MLRFAGINQDCCSPGGRIPALFVHSSGYLHHTMKIDDNGNSFYDQRSIRLQTWYNIEYKQFLDPTNKVDVNIFYFNPKLFPPQNYSYCQAQVQVPVKDPGQIQVHSYKRPGPRLTFNLVCHPPTTNNKLYYALNDFKSCQGPIQQS